jgi:hypothetical protein
LGVPTACLGGSSPGFFLSQRGLKARGTGSTSNHSNCNRGNELGAKLRAVADATKGWGIAGDARATQALATEVLTLGTWLGVTYVAGRRGS